MRISKTSADQEPKKWPRSKVGVEAYDNVKGSGYRQ